MNDLCNITTAINDKDIAAAIINVLLEKKLIAGAQISVIDSYYSWNKRVVFDKEYLITMKSRKSLFKKIEEEILKLHPYEVAEIIAYDITAANSDFSSWILENTK